MLLSEFSDLLARDFPELHSTLHVGDLIRFAVLAAEVVSRSKDAWHFKDAFSIIPFLQAALEVGLSTDLCHQLWHSISPILSQFHVKPGQLIKEHGYRSDLSVKIPEFTLLAPVKECLLCNNANKGRQKLHYRSQLHGYLYDLDGVHTAGIVSLKCPQCATYYRPSYYSAKGLRTYYSAQNGRNEDMYQVSCHYFMTHRLAEFMRNGQMLAHISNFNLVNIFNLSHVDYASLPELESAPKVLPSLSETTCRDALDVHTLLNRADSRQSCLSVDTSAPPHQRYHQAMQAVLEWIALEGSHHRDHVCSACIRVVPLPGEHGNPKLGYIRAVVTDGITIGHWRCSATPAQLRELAQADGLPPPEGPCTSPLGSVKDRFCPHHQKRLGSQCLAQPCGNDALQGHQTCGLQEHMEAYAKFKTRVTSNFTLTSMLNRPGSHLPSDPTVHQDWETAELTGLEDVQHADESDRAHEQGREGGNVKTCKVCLSRSRTHNDQLIVSTCGIILARETFFHSESVSAVRDFLLRTFPRKMPEVCFYDNACNLVSHIYHGGKDYSAFLKTVFPVDPFHFRGHKESDEFCQYYTDPKLFPQLQEEDGSWFFNASAGEIANLWYGGFASIARSMSSIRFNFMMEDMVERRNNWLLKRLAKRADISFIGNLPM